MQNDPKRPSRSRQRQQQRKKRRQRRRVLTIVLIVLLILLLSGIGGILWYSFLRDPGEYERYQFDTEAMEGRIQQMTEEEIQAELNRVVEEGMFNISIASSIVFESPTGRGQARIENVPANRYHMKVEIYLDDTQECVYSSRLIRPGYSIEYINLNRALEPGEYAATAIFSAITQQEMQLFGTAGAQITLYIPDETGSIPRATAAPLPSAAP